MGSEMCIRDSKRGEFQKVPNTSKIAHFRTAVIPHDCPFWKSFRSLFIRYIYSILRTLRVGDETPLEIFEKIFERERAVAQRVGGFEWVPDILPLVNFYSLASDVSRDMWQHEACISET